MLSTAQKALLVLAALLYVAAGSLHFARPQIYLKIMPPCLPWPLLLIYISGAAEIAGGIGLLLPPFRRAAAWGLTALLIAVFPANLYMATNQIQVTDTALPAAVLWARLPLQLVLIWWVLWCRDASRKAPNVL